MLMSREMSCFPCFGGGGGEKKEKKEKEAFGGIPASSSRKQKQERNKHTESDRKEVSNGNIAAHTFTFRELAAATKNFTPDCLLGEGGFGRVYQGCLEGSGQIVAVKQLDRNGLQGNKEFLVEVLMLSHLHHPNLVNLIGYCADGDQRLLVYEFMSRGSVEDHLLDLSSEQKPLDWYRRMKIAYGAAQGLEYLHEKANPPVIYRDLKSSNILLDNEFMSKLSDFGLAKLGPMGDKTHVSSRVMGTYGYCAPEYARTGHLTPKSDVYSFGVVLLELITGRRVIDPMRPSTEQNLVSWAQPMFKDQKRFSELVDPLIKNNYPAKGLNQAVAVAAMCLQDEASVRPMMADVVIALSFLIDALPTPQVNLTPTTAPVAERPRSSDSESSDRGAVETIQLTKKKRGSARHEKVSSSRHGSRHGSLKHRRRSSQGGSDGSSSSKHSRESSWHGADVFDSDRSGEAPLASFKTPHGSSHYGSVHSVSSRGSRHGSRRSEESEYESELM